MTKLFFCDIILGLTKRRECSSMVEFQPSKLAAWVRFPSLAPVCAHSSVDRVPGYEPVGRRFESSWARQKARTPFGVRAFCSFRGLMRTCAAGTKVRKHTKCAPSGFASAKAGTLLGAPKSPYPFWGAGFLLIQGLDENLCRRHEGS